MWHYRIVLRAIGSEIRTACQLHLESGVWTPVCKAMSNFWLVVKLFFELKCVASLKTHWDECLINVRYFILFNLSSANAPLIYPLKTSENIRFHMLSEAQRKNIHLKRVEKLLILISVVVGGVYWINNWPNCWTFLKYWSNDLSTCSKSTTHIN